MELAMIQSTTPTKPEKTRVDPWFTINPKDHQLGLHVDLLHAGWKLELAAPANANSLSRLSARQVLRARVARRTSTSPLVVDGS